MIQFQENAWTEGWTERQKDEQTLFYRTLPATAGFQKVPSMLDINYFHKKHHGCLKRFILLVLNMLLFMVFLKLMRFCEMIFMKFLFFPFLLLLQLTTIILLSFARSFSIQLYQMNTVLKTRLVFLKKYKE